MIALRAAKSHYHLRNYLPFRLRVYFTPAWEGWAGVKDVSAVITRLDDVSGEDGEISGDAVCLCAHKHWHEPGKQ